MSEKLYLPISILLSTLILSGTIFLVGIQVNNNLAAISATGLVVANPSENTGTGNNGAGNLAPAEPTQPTQPAEPVADMGALLEGASLISGSPDAGVKIVEFSDFECPFCGRVTPTLKAIEQKYGNKIAVYYQHFPLTSIHPNAMPAAIASECAAEQGKFKEYHDKLFENQTALSTADLKKYAVDLGLKAEQFNSCLDSSKYSSTVNSDQSLGTRAGVSGTPTFFINGQKLVGAQPQANFEAVIDPLVG